MQTAVPTKPRLRGVSHEIAFYVSLLAGLALVLRAGSPAARTAAAVYGASLAAMFGISALYHRPTWTPRARQWLRRLDHSAIFLLIAGTYTPVCLLVLESATGAWLLRLMWLGTALGILRSLFWVHAPRAITAALYVGLAWVAVLYMPQMAGKIGLYPVLWLLAGGLLYTGGAVVYALKRPDPIPAVFGYHEVFHVLVIAAAACHFFVVARMLGAA